MISVRKIKTNQLDWTQKKRLRKLFELTADGEIVGTLAWKKSFGSLAVGECDKVKYSFKRGGFLKPFVTVRKVDLDYELATIQMSFGNSGIMNFNDGKIFKFQKLSFWKPEWGFIDENDRLVCTITHKARLRSTGIVMLEGSAKPLQQLPVLLLASWYIIILTWEEGMAAASAASAGG